ncbi:MAG: sensor histidine kinase [Cyanobacteria bacterium J06600_6]
MNTDEYLLEQSQAIAEKLIEAIASDSKIASSCSLSTKAIRNNIPAICETIIRAIANNNISLLDANQSNRGDIHGQTRSAQNFEPEEIVREFFLLKKIILGELEPRLLAGSISEALDYLSLVDLAIDKVMENCFRQYAKRRKQQVDNLHQQIFLTNQEISRLLAEHQDSLDYLIHEIKNPLTSIIGYSDLYLRQQRQDSSSLTTANLEHIQQVLCQGRNILRLINDTLELSAYQKGELKLRQEKIDVCLLQEKIALSLKSNLEAKQLKLITSCLPQKLVIESDPLRIQQIITNLLTNAIRYTKEGTITLTSAQTALNELEIKVIDTGVGIADDNRDRIFEPYFRSDLSQQSVPEGVGLGLAIVAQLVSLLGGKIEVDSQLNTGSTFTIKIPITPARL